MKRLALAVLAAIIATSAGATAPKMFVTQDMTGCTWTGLTCVDCTISGTQSGNLATDAIAGATATTMAIANTVSTAVSIGNSAACDTITIGTNTDADTITIGDSTDTAVSITDDNWSISVGGVGTFASLATNTIAGGTATTMTVGDTISTAVSIGNSAACDSITIGTNTDADTITIGEANDTAVSITDNDWSIGVGGIASLAHIRHVNGSTLTAADVNISKATLQAANFFLVDTASNTVDVDFADDAALDAADVGSEWLFVKVGAGTNAFTVTPGASGVTTVTNHTIGAAATAEDIGDIIRCTAYTTTAIVCEIAAAD